MEWLVEQIKWYDPDLTIESMIWLQFSPLLDDDSILAAAWLTAETMEYLWTRRKKKETILIPSLTSHLLLHAEHFMATKNHKQAAYVIKEIIS